MRGVPTRTVDAIVSAATALVACLFLAAPTAAGVLDFSAAERAQILSHGPWPPAPRADASNRVHIKD